SIWAWGRGLTSWLIDHVVLEGGPEKAQAWAALTELLGFSWPHEAGTEMGISRLAIDTGYEAPAVYAWARRMGSGQVVAVKGVDGFSRPAPVIGPSYVDATEGGRKIRRGAKLWTVATATFKSETYRFLRLDRPTEGDVPPAGTIHLPRNVDAEWVKQLVAEQLTTVKTRRGFSRLEWQKMRERNEALDCRVYARAAAWIAGLDRWSERKWRELEAQLGVERKAPGVIPASRHSQTGSGSPEAATVQPKSARLHRPAWLGGRRRTWLTKA
ncbi:MAG: phage terminase large subunit family protein, partial [Defluviicoccus sp.]|nr:phage terminase large subunit family protein [Defluviicoccus sp.]